MPNTRNVDDISTIYRNISNTGWGKGHYIHRGRKDKSHDAILSFEGQISKLELGVANTKGDVDL